MDNTEESFVILYHNNNNIIIIIIIIIISFQTIRRRERTSVYEELLQLYLTVRVGISKVYILSHVLYSQFCTKLLYMETNAVYSIRFGISIQNSGKR
jgi:predicted Na+-dependent transporter